MADWNAEQYLKFGDERTRPCIDLVTRLPEFRPRRIIDLGCGPGNSTGVLAQRWPEAGITGLDSSPEMAASARRANPKHQWVTGDIATWTPEEPFDLVFSNAALQWVKSHEVIFPRLLEHVAPGGMLAVQMPANLGAPGQRLLRELAASAGWRNRFTREPEAWSTHEPPFYYDALASRAARLDIWTTEYVHILADHAAIVEWYKGTALRPFLNALPNPADQQQFLAGYLGAITAAYPAQSDGRVLFPFRRLFLIAARKA